MENINHNHSHEGNSCNCDECGKNCCKDICGRKWKGRMKCSGGSGCIYGLGFIGALVYYLGHASTFGMGVLGALKALVWPAMIVYKLMGFLGM